MDKAALNEQIVQDFVSDEENTLAEELKRWCTRFGEEQEDKLDESGTALLNLGKLYIRKATDNPGMLQKLSLIKACALINGARVRFELIENKELELQAVKSLEEFSEVLYKICNIENSIPIDQISRRFFRELNTMRQDARGKVCAITWVEDGLLNDDVLAKELAKIEDVKKLTETMTEDYKNFLCEISRKCTELLGKPPCRFAQVGLGSLAREEITFYSDFEHVLVIEDEAKLRDDFTQILEYFRWFAVLFQCVLIGFGETVIRSVGVKSINDLYSADKTKNWFYDVITPSGVAFDGMVPHSCMNPLGRQDPTKARKHAVEFIQPASEMAKFLTADAHIKNGYYIKDILARTCFVYGDEIVFEKFLSESKNILNSEKMEVVAMHEAEKIDTNTVVHLKSLISLDDMEGIDAKVTFYRPVTALLAFFARSRGIKTPKTYDIITELQRRGVITKSFEHTFKFAWAVSCEIRLKAYFAAGQQRHCVSLNEIKKMASARSIYKCREAITSLSAHVRSVAILEPNMSNLIVFMDNQSKRTYSQADWLMNQGRYSEAILMCCAALRTTTGAGDSYRFRHLLAGSYFLLGSKTPEKIDELYEKARIEYQTLLAMGSLPILQAGCYLKLAEIYEHQGLNEEALKMCDEWYKLYRNDTTLAYKYHHSLIVIIPLDLRIRRRSMPAEELLEYLTEMLAGEPNIDGRMWFKIEIAKTYIDLGFCDDAKSYMTDLVEEICAHTRQLLDPKVLLQDIIDIQVRNKWYADGNKALDELIGLPRRFGTSYDGGVYKKDMIDALKLLCLSSLGLNEAGMDYFEKMSAESQIEFADFWSVFVLNHSSNKVPIGEDKVTFWKTMQRGVDLCKKFPKEDKFLDLYATVLSQVCVIFGCFFVNEVADIFCPAPLKARMDERVTGAISQELRNKFLLAYLTSERNMTLETATEHTKVALANYSAELLTLHNAGVYYTLARVISVPGKLGTDLLAANLDLISRLFGLGALSREEYASILWNIVNIKEESKRAKPSQLLLELLATSCGSKDITSRLNLPSRVKNLATELTLRKEVAEIQMANGEAEKAKTNLSGLVKFVRFCGEFNSELKTLLKMVMFIQRERSWMDDALVTVDLVLSLGRDHGDQYDAISDQFKLAVLLHAGLYDSGIKHIEEMCQESIRENSFTVVTSYLVTAMTPGSITRGFSLINKGLAVAREFSAKSEYETMYVRSLIFILRNAGSEDLRDVADLFNKASHAVQQHSHVKPLAAQFLNRILGDATTQGSCDMAADVKAQLHELVDTPLLATACDDSGVAALLEKMQICF